MVPLAGNFSRDKRFARTGWMCRCGGDRQEEQHILYSCPLYADIGEQYNDLCGDNQLVEFFRCWIEGTPSTRRRRSRLH